MQQTDDKLYKIRHSLAHVLAQAVLELRPNAKLAFGPPVDNGCYYDFLLDEPISSEDFDEIEKRMRRIISEKQEFVEEKRKAEEAIEYLKQRGENFKVEYCQELIGQGEKEIGFYKNGPFEDMCAGPHVEHTGQIPADAFKIDTTAGAYWRGDERNPMLTRIYCLAFKNKKELKEYLKRRELAKERDHRKLGKELDLFSIDHDGVGAGLILWHPKGGIVRHLIEEHAKNQHLKGGYKFVYTPHIGRSVLWETSGHLSFYKEGMFSPIEVEGQEFYLKPMNCPFHCKIYASSIRSYRDLPLRFAEWGTVYRYEKSGTLSGLTRVRGFTQDDAHLFCREDQMAEEIDKVLEFSTSLLKDFGLGGFHLYLSTRPEKRVGEERFWDMAEDSLKAALERSGLPYSINEGDGAFYGPKIDIYVRDALERPWQLSTIQFDFNLPERFDLHYTDKDGSYKRPFMIHRALCGSMERFFAILVEHHGGAFPTWLAPVQVRLIPVADPFLEYAENYARELKDAGYRVEVDRSDNSFNKKIREAVTSKIPNMLIVGAKEQESGKVTLRRYCVKEQLSISKEEFMARMKKLVSEKLADNDPETAI
ncbi:MAG: threonine--tRNA ligase [Candidatus Dadabacteria bacterium]|nr:MAG: threonine--tRNA ligase [Candidatus Dadabacteria bacterium]